MNNKNVVKKQCSCIDKKIDKVFNKLIEINKAIDYPYIVKQSLSTEKKIDNILPILKKMLEKTIERQEYQTNNISPQQMIDTLQDLNYHVFDDCQLNDNYISYDYLYDNYISKDELYDNYISKDELYDNYISKGELYDNYISKDSLIWDILNYEKYKRRQKKDYYFHRYEAIDLDVFEMIMEQKKKEKEYEIEKLKNKLAKASKVIADLKKNK